MLADLVRQVVLAEHCHHSMAVCLLHLQYEGTKCNLQHNESGVVTRWCTQERRLQWRRIDGTFKWDLWAF